MSAYYNEIDRYCCDWLQALMDAGHITPGKIDDRSIADLTPDDVRGYERCHFFAGIGGWELALEISRFSGPVWTGSCPCPPFSSANVSRRRNDDERNLWPSFFRLISASRPHTVFGEQTAQSGYWFDGVCDDVESVGYTIGAAVLPACSVGADHARHRIYFVCHADSKGKPNVPVYGEASWVPRCQGNDIPLVSEDGLPNRMAILRGFGNAIVPQVAAEFIKASMT